LPDLFDLAVVCDIDEEKAKQAAEQFSIPEIITDLGELCARDDIGVIDLCTPPYLHFEQIQQVLRAGKNAVCEKPLVSSLKEVDALKEVERETGKSVMPIFQYRFGHALQKVKFLVDQGLGGKAYLATVETAWRRRANYYAMPWRGKWKTELGGVLLTHAVHAHDMLCHVMGPIKSVFARVATRVNPIEVEDCASVSLEFANGCLASLSATLGSSKEITRHRFCFEGFCAESNTSAYHNSEEPWTISPDSPEDEEKIEQALKEFDPLPEWLEGQFTLMAKSLAKGAPPPVVLDDARTALELVTAIYHSAETGEAVDLPIGADHPQYGSWIPK
jgi:predicted dehydrogenase